jgi:hypothetical protein
VELGVLTDDPLLDREEDELELTVLVTVVDCDLAVLELAVVVSAELLVRMKELVCEVAGLGLDDERRELIDV